MIPCPLSGQYPSVGLIAASLAICVLPLMAKRGVEVIVSVSLCVLPLVSCAVTVRTLAPL